MLSGIELLKFYTDKKLLYTRVTCYIRKHEFSIVDFFWISLI